MNPDGHSSGGSAGAAELTIDVDSTLHMLTEFIRTEAARTGRRKLIVGLSGGIDSAVAAYLAVRALGPESVRGLLLPFRTSSPTSLTDAEEITARLGMESDTLDISPMVDAFSELVGEVGHLRLGNVMARARMTLLFDFSEEHDALVLGTSNKTELLLGYGTLHGDLASAFNPLGDLYKTQVRTLAAELGVPEAIRLKRPSADLWPDQSDEDELGFGYDEVDRLLVLLVDERFGRDKVVELGFPRELVERVVGLIVRSQFKRRLPAIAKLSKRPVGWDFRYPRDWRS